MLTLNFHEPVVIAKFRPNRIVDCNINRRFAHFEPVWIKRLPLNLNGSVAIEDVGRPRCNSIRIFADFAHERHRAVSGTVHDGNPVSMSQSALQIP